MKETGKRRQRDVVDLDCPIGPSYMSPNAGGGGGLYTGAQISFGDITPYLAYETYGYIVFKRNIHGSTGKQDGAEGGGGGGGVAGFFMTP